MEYIACVLILAFLVFVFRVFSFRARSINCSINALKKTIDTLPDESTPSGSVMKAKLANKYYELSHRVQSNDIRDYAKKMLSIQAPQPKHIAMLLLSSLSRDFLQELHSTNMQAYGDIAKWCKTAHDDLVEQERTEYTGT